MRTAQNVWIVSDWSQTALLFANRQRRGGHLGEALRGIVQLLRGHRNHMTWCHRMSHTFWHVQRIEDDWSCVFFDVFRVLQVSTDLRFAFAFSTGRRLCLWDEPGCARLRRSEMIRPSWFFPISFWPSRRETVGNTAVYAFLPAPKLLNVERVIFNHVGFCVYGVGSGRGRQGILKGGNRSQADLENQDWKYFFGHGDPGNRKRRYMGSSFFTARVLKCFKRVWIFSMDWKDGWLIKTPIFSNPYSRIYLVESAGCSCQNSNAWAPSRRRWE